MSAERRQTSFRQSAIVAYVFIEKSSKCPDENVTNVSRGLAAFAKSAY